MPVTKIKSTQIESLRTDELILTGAPASSTGYVLMSNGTGGVFASGVTLNAPDGVIYNSSDTTITLLTSNLNSVLVVNNSSNVAVNLPSVSAVNVGTWIMIYKIGTGHLTINAADSDVINDSSAGGSIANTTTQTYAAIKIQLVTATMWATASMPLGTWTTS